MKITVSNESVVLRGKAYEESAWGYYQFPELHRDNDGNFYCSVHVADDHWKEIMESSKAWFISKDGGKSWQPTQKNKDVTFGTKLKNGDIIYFPKMPPYIVDEKQLKRPRLFTKELPGDTIEKQADGSWPYPIMSYCDVVTNIHYIYDMETVPDAYAKKQWHMVRLKAGETEAKEELVPIEHPYMSLTGVLADGKICMLSPWPICRVKVDDEGSVWVTHYAGGHLNPNNGAPNRHSAVFIYKSTDNAHTFKLQSYIPFVVDLNEDPEACFADGFNESDIEFLSDGSIICLMRTNNVYNGGPEWGPMYIAKSTDGGKTFSRPEKFGDFGVLPNLVKLNCGVVLAAYGRPGIFVRALEDSKDAKWGERIEIIPATDRSELMNNPPMHPNFHQYVGSCCNVCLKAINDNQALLVYSDFYYPDEKGKKKLKTILSRIITVEK